MVEELDDFYKFADQVDRHGNVGTRDKRGAKRGSKGYKTLRRNSSNFISRLARAAHASATVRRKRGIT